MMQPRQSLVALWLLVSCGQGGEPSPAQVDPVKTESTPDLSSDQQGDSLARFSSRRASGNGAELEARRAELNSQRAQSLHASTEDEPGLLEIDPKDRVAGEDGGRSSVGTAAPTDLDRASGELAPWLDLDRASQVIRDRKRGLQTCHSEALSRTGALERRLELRVTIDTFGRAVDVEYTDRSRVQDRGLLRCLSSVLGKANFPEAQRGPVTFDYPLSL